MKSNPATTNGITQMANNIMLSTNPEQSLYNMLMQAPVAMIVLRGEDNIIEFANDFYSFIAGKNREDLLNKPAFEVMPEAATQGFVEILRDIRATGKPL